MVALCQEPAAINHTYLPSLVLSNSQVKVGAALQSTGGPQAAKMFPPELNAALDFNKFEYSNSLWPRIAGRLAGLL